MAARSSLLFAMTLLGAALLGTSCGRDEMKKLELSKQKLAKLAVDRLAGEMWPRWAMANPATECPDSVSRMTESLGLAAGAATDPWGTPYQLRCGKDRPPGVRDSVGVVSFGPDRQAGTGDDINSWTALVEPGEGR